MLTGFARATALRQLGGCIQLSNGCEAKAIVRPRIERPRQTIIDAAAVEAAELLEAADDAQAADGDGAVVVATACISERGAPSPKHAGIPYADARWPP